MIHFSLLDFMFPVNFMQVESATPTALEAQALLWRLFLFLTPPINKCVSFLLFFFLFSPLHSFTSFPITTVPNVPLYAGKACSYMAGRNTTPVQWQILGIFSHTIIPWSCSKHNHLHEFNCNRALISKLKNLYTSPQMEHLGAQVAWFGILCPSQMNFFC